MLIMGIEVTVPGSKVGRKIGNPTNIESKSEPDCSATSDTSKNTGLGCQTSKYAIIFVNYIIVPYILFL